MLAQLSTTADTSCPSTETLAKFVRRELPDHAERVITAHLKDCDDCRQFVEIATYLLDDVTRRRT